MPQSKKYFPPVSGGTVLMANEEVRLNAHKLLNYIVAEKINRIDLPVVALQYLAEAAETEQIFPIHLQEVMTGGEQLKITPQIIRFFSALPGCILINAYGPTEASVQVTEFELFGNPDLWPLLPPVGKPISGAEVFIVDQELNLLKWGEEGELCISGVCLAQEYLNRPELTKEKFIDWQHPGKGTVRIYRTGDLARYTNDGNIEFLGRKDDQVKIRGYRIEPGEIELALVQLENIHQAVVIAKEKGRAKKIGGLCKRHW